jgi:pimeloyl-ACP methyl ester carboxylesterase
MHEEQLEFTTDGGKLSGTLALPQTPPPWPVALLIAGAGPADRDGNSALLPGAPGHMRRLAQGLAAQGIASLRYDKRGVGASVHPGLNEEDLRFRHLVDDAVTLADRLREDERLRMMLLLGHSEGALVAALAARHAAAQGVVSVAGAGMRASELMRQQLQGRLPELLEEVVLAALATLAEEQMLDDPPDALTLLFRPTVQPYLISWFRYDPAEVLADLPVPALLVHGSADTQVPAHNVELLHAARPDARLLLVPDMDHLLGIGGNADAGPRRIAGAVAELVQELERSTAA